MKTILSFASAILAVGAIGQATFTYRDRTGDLTITAKGGLVEQPKAGQLKLTLTGSPVVLRSRSDGLELRAPRLVCNATSVGGKTNLKAATASGGLTVTRAGGTSTSSSGTYTATEAGGQLDLRGNVRLVDRGQRNRDMMVVTGSNGTALLGDRGVERATLAGPVRATIVQQGGGTVVATGSRMMLNRAATPATIVLAGNVSIKGSGQNTLGEIQGADRAVLTLNTAGEVRSVRIEQGASQ